MDSDETQHRFFVSMSDLFSNDNIEITSYFQDESIVILQDRFDKLQHSVCLTNGIMMLGFFIFILIFVCNSCCKRRLTTPVIYAEPVKVAEPV